MAAVPDLDTLSPAPRKGARPAAASVAAVAGRETLVVVGNGMVGFRFLSQLQEHAAGRFQVVVFGEESLPAYDRVHLTSSLQAPSKSGRIARGTPPSLDELLLAPREWYAQHGIDLHTGDPVMELDRGTRTIRSRGGRTLRYDHLVLATGSEPLMPPIPGRHEKGVFVCRTVNDLQSIRERARSARRAVIVGGGLLGLEAARALQTDVANVDIIEAGSHLMHRQLDPATAAVLQRQLERLGLEIHLATTVSAIQRGNDGLVLTLDVGRSVARGSVEPLGADLVVLAAGIRPRDDLARQAGLVVAPGGGIVVDDRLQTSDPRILALGECARHRGAVYGLVGPGYEMARVAVDRLLGGEAKFERGDSSCRLKLLGVDVTVVGECTPAQRTVSWERGDVRRTLVLRDERLVGAFGVGPWPELPELSHAVAERRRLTARTLGRFERVGTVSAGGATLAVLDWPAPAMVCACARVTRGDLGTACAAGARSVDALAAKTGAGSVCGGCRPLLAELCGEAAPARAPRGGSALFWVSLAALAVAVLFAFPGPLPYGASAQGALARWAPLWREMFWKQLTGFGLIGSGLLAMLLPLRKRLAFFRRRDYGWFRLFHGAVGLLAASLLVAHTGLHLGANLNQVLACDFLGVLGTGTAVGITAAFETQGVGARASAARRLRPALTRIHVALLWALPVLVFFHVLAVYTH